MTASSMAPTKVAGAIAPTIPMLIGGEWRAPAETTEVRCPYRGEVVSYAPTSSLSDLDAALSAAVAAKSRAAAMPGYERAKLLRRVGALLVERADYIAEVLTRYAIRDMMEERLVVFNL